MARPQQCLSGRFPWPFLAVVFLVTSVVGRPAWAQVQITPGTNVNMVSGTAFPDGDPFLQRQNEPSLGVSTRNPLHLLGGANDYRTVDLPGPLDPIRGGKMNADAWLGLFKSFDGGRTWRSSLLPGFPQDTSPEGLASPLKGRQAGTDPVVRAGTNGLFYYAGLAFDRGSPAPSTIFVARYIDRNDREEGDPFAYLGTSIVDSDTGSRFLDKTALAVDIPRGPATCTIDAPLEDGSHVTQVFPAGPVYIAYSAFIGTAEQESRIVFSRSLDCGTTWSTPKVLSAGHILNQNAQIAVSYAGTIYVSWRRFQSGSQGPAVLVTKSVDGGATFSRPVVVASIAPFDQGTTTTSFRTNAFQTMTVDRDGRVYIAWPERGHAVLRPDPVTGDSRIVVTTSRNGNTWTTRQPIETGGLGHQLMPALTFHAGKLRLLYYDLREDVSQLFGPYIDESPILTAPDPKPPRHTIDVYVAQASPGAAPRFQSRRLSDYAVGVLDDGGPAFQLQFNPPNLPLFRQGTAPFMGDYIDLAPAPPFVQAAHGEWVHNVAAGVAVSHAAWADNRDVRAPADGDWTNYTPVVSPSLGSQSLFDPSQQVPTCTSGQTGMRNQNIYTAKVTEGLFVASPGNTKPLGLIQRAFVVTAENATASIRTYRLTILSQPPGGQASFSQFTTAGTPVTQLDASVPPLSTIARTVFVTSSDPDARVRMAVNEIAAPGGGLVPNGLSGTVTLNGDPTNPRIQNPRIQNPRIQNPDIQVAETYDPGITNAILSVSALSPRIQNPTLTDPSLQDSSVTAPRLQNSDLANPDIINATAQAPRIQNLTIQNPRIQNPRIQNTDLTNGAIHDTSWVITNDGNTTASYAIKLVLNGTVPTGIETQLVIHKTYFTPGADNCTLAQQPQSVIIASIPDPAFITDPTQVTGGTQNPRIQNPTISLAPGESAFVTLRVTDPNRYDAVSFDAGAAIAPVVVAHSVNTTDAAQGVTTPPVAIPLTVTSAVAASGSPGAFYSSTLQAFGSVGAVTWSVTSGTLPPGLTLDPQTGTISGTPTAPGNYVFTVQSIDTAGNTDTQTLAIRIDPPAPSGFAKVWNGADTDWTTPTNWSPAGVPLATDTVYVPAAALFMPRLLAHASVAGLVVESGATLDTNGFTLTVAGDVDAGNAIAGSGSVVMTGAGVTARGTFPGLNITGTVTVGGPLTVQGRLTLGGGARLDLNGTAVVAAQELVTSAPSGVAPLITGAGASLTVGGVNVNGLTLDRVLLRIQDGLLIRFDTVRFVNYAPTDVQLTIDHPGLTAPIAATALAFFVPPTTGRYIQANDTAADGRTLVVNISGSVPADGSAASGTTGGAVVNWLANPTDASLGVAQSASPSPAAAGTPLTYTIVVANGGPATATNVALVDTLPAGVTFVSALAGQGSCSHSSGIVTCALGTLAPGATTLVTVVVIPTVAATIDNVVAVTANESDPTAVDNSQIVSTAVVAATAAADLSIVKSDSADPVSPGAPFSYTLTVHNNGPATATNVVVGDVVPGGLTVSTATSTHGGCTIAGQAVTCAVGTLAPSDQATVTITVTAAAAGLATNTATVTAAQADPNTADNTASESTMVSIGGCGVLSFGAPMLLPTSSGAEETAAGDLNGDGAIDLVTAVPNANEAAVFLGNGTGGFTPGTSVTGMGPDGGVLLADFNGDQRLDLVVTHSSSEVALRLGNGAGGFGAPATFSFATAEVLGFRSGDLNGDGWPDLVVGTRTPDELHVLLNDQAGSFTRGQVVPVTAEISQGFIRDLNGDGHPDVAISYGTDDGSALTTAVDVFLGDGTGGLAAPVSSAPYQTAVFSVVSDAGDLNGDGHRDLVTMEVEDDAGTIRRGVLLLGDGTGHFIAQLIGNAAPDIQSLAAADLNGDGNTDLVFGTQNSMVVQSGSGAGAFAAPVRFAALNDGPPLLADVTGDGLTDIVVSSFAGVSILANRCGGNPVDLAVAVTDSPDPIAEGGTVTYSVDVTNPGSATATNVVLTALLDAPIIGSGGAGCAVVGRVISCDLGSLAPGATATRQFTYFAVAGGTMAITAGVGSADADTNPSDNTAIEITTVTVVGRNLFVSNTNDTGSGSLRYAILDSNADVGDLDRIVFNIPGTGVHTITLASPLPDITQPVVIDGTTQAGYSGTPIVELHGSDTIGRGLVVVGGGTTIRALVVNRFTDAGIYITGGGGNVVEGCFVGTDATGTTALPNPAGIVIRDSASNRIGGTAGATRNVVSGNFTATGAAGIVIAGPGSTGNQVLGNFVGVDATGATAVPNGVGIVLAQGASSNTVGGTATAARNVISGNGFSGVSLFDAGTNANHVSGNYIGLNAAGMARIGNVWGGVVIQSGPQNNIVGGNVAGAGNVVSGNLFDGVQVYGAGSTANVVAGNLIGTDPSGAIDAVAFGNEGAGITLGDGTSGNAVGGTSNAERNVVAGNQGNGIVIGGNGAHNNTIRNNVIDRNLLNGIRVFDAANNGIGPSNVITGNGQTGVLVEQTATGNGILTNQIVGNGALGIDLGGDGVTPNDPGDADAGANNLQNFPVITSAVTALGTTTVQATLNSTPNTSFFVGLFGNTACDPSGYGEGGTLLAATPIVTDGAGDATFFFTVPAATFLTALAHDPGGNSSEFSACVAVTAGNAPPVANAGSDQAVPAGTLVQLDGTGSSDPESQPLTYAWIMSLRPGGSGAVLSNAASATPTFVADMPGTYVVQLVVNDGVSDSPPDDVTITALTNDIGLALAGTPLVGVGRTATLQITLPAAAPPGGTTVTVTSDNTSILTVGPPNSASVAGGGTTAQLTLNGINPGSTIVRANAAGYTQGTLGVTVTSNVLTVPSTLNVPFGQTASMPVNIPQPAPAGGIVVGFVSAAPGVIEVVTPSVTIPQGALSANGTVRGLNLGSALVTASSPGFSSDASQVSSTGALNILEAGVSFAPGFPASVTIRLESGGAPVAAPSPGLTVNLAAGDPACLAVPATVTIPSGLVSTTVQLSYGGTATLPCSTTLDASSSGLTSDAVPVTVNPTPGITMQGLPVTVGAGLQTNFNPICCLIAVLLGESQHGGVTVRIATSDPAVALVAPDSVTAGTASIDVAVPDGQTQALYYLQGVEGATGTVTITATVSGFNAGSGSVTVVQPALQMTDLPTTTTSLSANTDFRVMVGLPAPGNGFVGTVMPVRAGHTLTASVTSTDAGVGLLQTQAGGTAQTLPVTIAAGNYVSSYGVAFGGIAFDPVGSGMTMVSATIPGFIATTAASVGVTVDPAGITMQGLPVTVGAGLQTNFNPFCCQIAVALGGSQHGGVTVHITSDDPAVALVSPDATTAGTASIDVVVPDGQTLALYYVQGVEGASGTVTITATASAFGTATGDVTVVQPAVQIVSLPTSTTSLSANIDFQVMVGLPAAGNAALAFVMPVRAGQTLTASVTSTDAGVGLLQTQAGGTAQTLPVTIAAGNYLSAYGVASGGIAFDPVGGGATTVSATIPGFIATTAASVDVTVDPAGMTMQGLPVTVGAGLQTNFNPVCCQLAVALGGSQHGGVTVHITSDDPAVALVSPDATTAGTVSIDVVVPDGQTLALYYVQGVEGASGTATITATSSQFGSASGSVTVAQPAVQIIDLPPNTTSLSPNTDFRVMVGLPAAGNAALGAAMPVRAGHSLTATLTSSNPAVGLLETQAGGTAQSLTVTVPAGDFISPFGMAAGGIAFDPIGGGSTTVDAAIPGFITTAAGSVTVTVDAPGTTMQGLPVTVGAGLQTNFNPFCCQLAVLLGGSQHGGVTVHIASSNPAVAMVSPDPFTPGTASIDVDVPDGQTHAFYYVQGLEGASGTVTITASTPGFPDGTGTVTVTQAALQIFNLSTSMASTAANVDFEVYVGVPATGNTSLVSVQEVRAGQALTVTLTSSAPGVGQLETLADGTGQTVSVTIQEGTFFSPFGVGAGGVAFDPIAPGSTTVTASNPALITTAGGAVAVQVN